MGAIANEIAVAFREPARHLDTSRVEIKKINAKIRRLVANKIDAVNASKITRKIRELKGVPVTTGYKSFYQRVRYSVTDIDNLRDKLNLVWSEISKAVKQGESSAKVFLITPNKGRLLTIEEYAEQQMLTKIVIAELTERKYRVTTEFVNFEDGHVETVLVAHW